MAGYSKSDGFCSSRDPAWLGAASPSGTIAAAAAACSCCALVNELRSSKRCAFEKLSCLLAIVRLRREVLANHVGQHRWNWRGDGHQHPKQHRHDDSSNGYRFETNRDAGW